MAGPLEEVEKADKCDMATGTYRKYLPFPEHKGCLVIVTNHRHCRLCLIEAKLLFFRRHHLLHF